MNLKTGMLLLICGAITGISFGQKTVVDQVVAVVGNKMVKLSDIENEYLQMKAQGNADDDTKCAIFESILEHKLLLHQAIFDSLQVSDSQVESELNKRISYFLEKIGTTEKLEKYFNKSMHDIKSDLRESLHEQLLTQKMQGNIVQDITITPAEVKDFYEKLPKDSLPHINGQMELAQIAIYPPFSGKIIEEAKDKLLSLRKRILDGEKFTTLAALYSEDEGTARKGGELGFMAKGQLDPDFARAAFALNKPGDVSRIVESQFGYHIIQLIEKRGDKANTRHILIRPKPDPEIVVKAMHLLDSLANLIRKDSITFDKAVAIFSMDVDTRFNGGLLINPVTGTSKFENEQISPADFNAIKKLKVGEVSAPFESRDTKGRLFYKILEIKSITTAHVANLNDDYNQIQELAKYNKQKTILNNWFDEKRKTTFIQIEEPFRGCKFKSDQWLKSN